MRTYRKIALLVIGGLGLASFFGLGAVVRDMVETRSGTEVVLVEPQGVVAVAIAALHTEEEPIIETRRAAFLMEKAFYDGAFGAASVACPEGARAAIVNHHLLAKSFIAEALRCLDPKTKTVVLISPNHFSVGSGPTLTSKAAWETPYGEILPDTKTIDGLVGDGAIEVDEAPFIKEHGVGNIVAFIKRAMPEARIVPVILKDSMTREDATMLVGALDSRLPKDAVIVASIDFSHDATGTIARFHDRKSLHIIETGDLDALSPLDIDSEPSLRTILDLVQRRGMADFRMFRNTNSAELTKVDADDATSYITGVFVPGEAKERRGATLMFAGDVMLDRQIKTVLEKKGFDHVLGLSRRLLRGSDITIANLEGPVSSSPPPHNPDALRFIFDAKYLPGLKKDGITMVSLANNHTANNGIDGIDETKKLLDTAGIGHFGDPRNIEGSAVIVERGGLKFALVGYHRFAGNEKTTLAEIARVRPLADMVIVMPHWGTEYAVKESPDQRRLAHAFIDAGADAVIGAHPHVVEPVEVYKGRAIFYSLGNFVFDQTFSKNTQQGLTVGVAVEADTVTYSLMPVEMHSLRTGPMAMKARVILLSSIAATSTVDEAIKNNLAKGEFTLPRH